MLAYVYRSFQERAMIGTSSWTAQGIDSVLLLKDTYSFNADHQFVSDLLPATHEVAVTDYARIEAAPSVLGINVVRTGGIIEVRALPVSFPLMTATGSVAPRYAVFYDAGSADTNAEVAFIQDFEVAQDVNAEVLTIRPDPAENNTYVRFYANPTSVTP